MSYTIAEVAPFDLAFQAVGYFEPHLLLTNHVIGKRNVRLATQVRRHGGKVVVLPTEGRPNTTRLTRWHDENTEKPLVDLYCAWGEGTLGHLRDVPTIIGGCPRFDIYRDEYRHFIPSRSEMCSRFGLDPDRRVIGIATSFPQAKFHFHSQQFHQADSKDLGIYTPEETEEIPRNEWLSMQSLRQQIQSFKLNYPCYQYVIKPHPMEDIRLWQQWCKEWGIGLFIGHIWDFLAMVDLHIARAACITALEADIMNTPCYLYGDQANNQYGVFPKLWEWDVGDFSYTGNAERDLYLKSCGLVGESPSGKRIVAETLRKSPGIDGLDESTNLAADKPFSSQPSKRVNLVDLSRVLGEYNSPYPRQDNIGHWGKQVTRHAIQQFRFQGE